MSKFKPFKGVRPKQELVNELMLSQFDHVIERHAGQLSDEDLLKWAEKKGIAESDVDDSIKYFLSIGYGYHKLLENRFFLEEDDESFYLMGINWHGQWVYGLVGAIDYAEYWEGHVKKHEETLEENEAELLRITKAIDFNFNPMILTYQDDDGIDTIVETQVLKRPTYQYVSQDGLEHSFWVISEKETIQSIQTAFKHIDDYYIADGHHRIESGSLLAKERKNQPGNYGSFIATVFPASQLKMYEFNRVVKDIHGLTRDEFFEKLSHFFHITEATDIVRPTEKFTYGMYFSGSWYYLSVKDATQIDPDPVKQLDVSVLRHFVLTPVLGIMNVRKSDRIAFLDGSKGTDLLIRMVDRKEMEVGFTLCPPSVEEMIAIANHHEAMPPKATCIEPKVKSGIISRKLS